VLTHLSPAHIRMNGLEDLLRAAAAIEPALRRRGWRLAG
jgi:hypothetical protein